MWILAAILAAVFSGVTAILSKCGIKDTKSDIATAARTSVVLLFSWVVVFATGVYREIPSISAEAWIFLLLSGVVTCVSWLCFFKALAVGEVSKVTAVDKSSVVFSVLFAIVLFPEERNMWYVKLICLALIGIGTLMMTDIQKGENEQGRSWLFFAFLSAVFAAATSLFAKKGLESVDSNLATALRTCFVFLILWAVVIGKKEGRLVKEITKNDALFLTLSGIATGVALLFYYYAIQHGQVSVVVPIDKMSVLVTILFSLVVFKEKLSKKAWFGLGILTVGTVLMAIFS